MKVLILDDDYNLILETFVKEGGVKITEKSESDESQDWLKDPHFPKYKYIMSMKLAEFPYEKIVYRLYNPAKDVSDESN